MSLDPEFSRQLAGFVAICKRRRMVIDHLHWDHRAQHLSVQLAPRPREAQIDQPKVSRRSAGQGRLL